MSKLSYFKPNKICSNYLLIAIAGALLVLGFAPFNYPLIVFLSLSVFAYLTLRNPNHAFRLGLVFGSAYFGLGISWVQNSMHNYGNMSLPLAGFANLLLVLLMAIYPAFAGFFAHKIKLKLQLSDNWFLLFILPSSWMLFEWLRGWVLTGFPWILLGASQITSPFSGFMPIVGELGVGFVILLFSGLIAMSVKHKLVSLLAIALIWLSASLLQPIKWTIPTGETLKIALVQGNVPMGLKWQPGELQRIIRTHIAETRKVNHVDLVVWSEAALPVYYSQIKGMLPTFKELVPNGDLITGIIYDNSPNQYFNSLLQLNSKTFYHKRHLVPFGEYTPLANSLVGWLMNNLQIPMSNLMPGFGGNNMLQVKNTKIAPSICYEIIFADLIRQDAQNANFLLTVSNDAWFGDSLGPEQHLQIAQVRARENGKPLVRATNNGITAFVSEFGEIDARLESNIVGSLIKEVATFKGETFFGVYGNLPLFTILIIIFLGLIYARIKTSA